jgi:hypothetical protein
MKLVTKELRKKLPELEICEDLLDEEMTIVMKFFHPFADWRWYVVGGNDLGDGDMIFFGYVTSPYAKEFGYFQLSELESAGIQRDKFFNASMIEVLRGEVTGDLKRVALALAAAMLVAAGLSESIERAEVRLEESLNNGEALQRLQRMIELLGGDPRVCDDPVLLPRAAETVRLESNRAGYLSHIDTLGIGQAAQLLGAGRATKDDAIDPAVGLKMKVRLGDRIEAGMHVAELHVNRREHLEEAIGKVRTSLVIDDQIPRASELIYDRIKSGEG